MNHRPLGRSSLVVSPVALGTMSVAAGVMHSSVDEQQAFATIHAALQGGITTFDTAPGYGDGESEVRLGRALAQSGVPRDRYIVATKAGGSTLSRAEILADCDASLKRLGMTHIDLYQIHWPRRVVPLAESIGALLELKRAGKVREIGVCNFGPLDLADALAISTELVSDQVAYSMLTRGVEFELEPVCHRHGVGILCYSPLAQGLLSGAFRSADEMKPERCRSRHFAGTRPMSRHGEAGCERELFASLEAVRRAADGAGVPMSQLAVAWLLHQRSVACVLAGASTPAQVHANIAAAGVKLTADMLGALDAATRAVKQHLGTNLDPWQNAANSRIR